MGGEMFDIPVCRILLPNEQWIEITEYETEEDFEAHMDAIGKFMKAPKVVSGGEVTAEFDTISLSASRRVILQRRIKNWSFGEEVIPENIVKLPRFVADKVMEEIERLDGEQSKEDVQKKYLT